MVVLGGKVYVIGGFDGLQRINNVETYDPFHNCWSEVQIISTRSSVCIIISKLQKEIHANIGIWLSDRSAPTENIVGGSKLPSSQKPLLIRSQKQIPFRWGSSMDTPIAERRLGPNFGACLGSESMSSQTPSALVFSTRDTLRSLEYTV